MSHVLQALDPAIHAASSTALASGPFGPSTARFIFVAAHDTNIASIAGFLRANWYIPEEQKDPTLPGGGLVFELWRHNSDGSLWVITKYVSESLDQLRNNPALTLSNPPAIAPIFIPGCSSARADFRCSIETFRSAVQQNILPELTTP